MSRARSALLGMLAVVALAHVALPAPAHAQAGRTQVREGNRLYDQGRYAEAHQKYLEGLAAAPESPVILFNDGNALYRGEDYQRATEAYRRAIESGDPTIAGGAWYNLGNALYRQRQLEPSLEAYKQALRLRPDDVDAKHNLERVLQELQQQQQQQQQQPDPGDDLQQDQQQGQQDQQGPQDQQGQQQPQEQPQQDGAQASDGDQSPQTREGEGSPERRPGQMTREEAERLLDAIAEDPRGVERRQAPVTGPRPRRPW